MKIINKELLADASGIKIEKIEVYSPKIASKVQAGQFVVIMVSEKGERVPLTVVEKNADKGTITLIFQEAGLTTKILGKSNSGDSLYALVGPLGHPTEIKKYGRVILIGGGVGIAEIYPAVDRMIVLDRGKVAGMYKKSEITMDELIESMYRVARTGNLKEQN